MDAVALLGLIFTAIGSIAAVLQLLGEKIQASIFRLDFARTQIDPSLTAIADLMARIMSSRACTNYEVRNLATATELKDLWKIDVDAYGPSNIGFNVLQAWWMAYPAGIYGLFINGRISGALGIWPVNRKWMIAFASGRAAEEDLSPDIIRANGNRGTDSWYISGLVIETRLRGSMAVPVLLKEATVGWAIDGRLKHPVKLAAMAISNDGEKLLGRYGFSLLSPSERMKDHHPLYTREIGRKDILHLIHQHETIRVKL
jgi:hypothetical protein